MKNTLVILFLMPGFCFAQQESNTPPKPAADDCPNWNKKSKSSSKAEYFNYLRTNKAKDQLSVSNYPNTPQRAYPSKTIVRYTPEEDPFLVPKKARRTTKNVAAKNNMVNAGGTVNQRSFVKAEKEEVLQPKEPLPLAIKESMIVKPIEEEEKTTEKEIVQKAEPLTTETKSVIKDNPRKEKRSKKRSQRSSAPKKAKVCTSGNASKCPSF